MKKGWRGWKGEICSVPVKLDDHTHIIKSLYIEKPYEKKRMSIASPEMC